MVYRGHHNVQSTIKANSQERQKSEAKSSVIQLKQLSSRKRLRNQNIEDRGIYKKRRQLRDGTPYDT